MIGALIILAITVITGIVLYTYHRLTVKPEDDVVVQHPTRSAAANTKYARKTL